MAKAKTKTLNVYMEGEGGRPLLKEDMIAVMAELRRCKPVLSLWIEEDHLVANIKVADVLAPWVRQDDEEVPK